MSASKNTNTAIEMAEVSTGKNNANQRDATIEKAYVRDKRDLFRWVAQGF
jgi:hypothetical protein